MAARVTPSAALRRSGGAVVTRLLAYAWTVLALELLVPDRAAAQLSGSVGLDSDYRLRGYSLSNDRPVASAQLTYDDRSGLYFSLSALNELGYGSRFLGITANAGYARRLNEHVTIDAGVLRSQLRSAARGVQGYKYTEVYAGAYVGPVLGRVSYSPAYRMAGLSTLYAELEAGFEPARNWRLSAHLGMLTYLTSRDLYRAGDTHQDWRIGVSRQFGNVEIHSALSGAHPYEYSGYRVHKRVAATAGASISF